MRMSEVRDSLCPYLSSQLLVKKINPYNTESLEVARIELINKSGDASIPTFTPAVYPPPTLAILSIFSQLPWRKFRYLLLTVDTVGLVALLTVLSLSLGSKLYCPQSLIMWSVGFSWAPWHSGMATGNLAIPAISAGAVGWWASEQKRLWLASIFLLVSLMLKPQIGGLFVLILMLRRSWKPVCWGLAGWGGAFVVTALWMQKFTSGWWEEYSKLISAYLVTMREIDPSSANPLRHDLINLQRLFYAISENSLLVEGLVVVLVGLMVLAVIVKHKNEIQLPPPLLTAGTVLVIGLLPFYHRFYDASLLLFAVAWAISTCCENRTLSLATKAIIVGCIPFLVPGAAALAWAVNHSYFPVRVTATWWWEALVMSHQVWALLIVTAGLSYLLVIKNGKGPLAAHG
jgi:Glycosyltransferase family 87